MKKNLIKFFLKTWPVLLIFFIWFLFSKPFFIENKVPFPSAFQVNFFSPWNAYPGFSSPVKNNATPDVITQIYPWKNLTIDILKSGALPLWNPYSFSGTPHLANYQSAVFSPFNLLFFILPFINAWSILVLLQPLLAGIFTFYFLKSLKVSNEGSLISALAFMFCGFLVTWINYATLGYAILFLPLTLYLIEKYFQTKKSRYLSLLSLSIPLSFFSGHFQISLYFFAFVIFYQIFKFYDKRDFKISFAVFLSSIFGLFISLPQILPSIEAYQQSLRSGIFEKTESIPWGYIATFFAPDFLGNPVTRNDWFGHYAEWNAYIGLLPLIISLIPIFYKRSKTSLFFLLSGIISILLAFNSPLLDLIVNLRIPVLSTSAASRVIVIFSFSFAVLSGIGLDLLLDIIKNKNYKFIIKWLGAFFAVFAFLWTVVVLKLFIPPDKIIIARQNLLLPTGFFITLVFLLTFFLILKIKKQNFALKVFLLFIIFISALDLFRFSYKWIAFDSKSLVYPSVPVVKEFNKISSYERVLSNLGGEASIYYKLPSLEGYDAVYNRRYGEFIASLENGNLRESSRSVVSFPKNGLYSFKAINLLGVKYVVYRVSDGYSSWTFPFWNYKDGTFKLIYNDHVYQILENTEVFPRAFLVNKYFVETSSQKILNKMFDKNMDLRKEVVLEKNLKINLNGKNLNSKIENYSPNKVSVKTSADGDSILFLSDSFYPGWKAFVDGKETEILRADYAFRAVFVPKGIHTVVFSYEPFSFKLGVIGFVIGVLGVGILVLKDRLI